MYTVADAGPLDPDALGSGGCNVELISPGGVLGKVVRQIYIHCQPEDKGPLGTLLGGLDLFFPGAAI